MTHLLLGIWSQQESAGHQIMADLGFNDEKAKEVAKLVSSNSQVLLFCFETPLLFFS